MAFFSFIKNFGVQKVQDTGKGVVRALASWDPEGASEAEIKQMNERLDKIVKQVAEARQIHKKEQQEADEINKLYGQRLKAAEILEAKLVDTADADKAKLEQSLGKLLGQLETMQPEIEREEREAVEAKIFMEELELVAKTSAGKLKNARKTLDSAKRDMQMAKIREQRAKDQADRASMIAGINKETDQLGSALSAMQQEAKNANAKADAHSTKASLLATTKEEKDDDLIASAMAEAKGTEIKPAGSISDRLSALRKK